MKTRSFVFLTALCATVLLGSSVSEPIAAAQASDRAQPDLFDSKRDLNLGLATREGMLVDGNTAVFTVSEQSQRRDLNRDGDLDDNIVHVFNARSGNVRNLGLNSSPVELRMLLQD